MRATRLTMIVLVFTCFFLRGGGAESVLITGDHTLGDRGFTVPFVKDQSGKMNDDETEKGVGSELVGFLE